jgi:hypothetical protein
MLRGKTVECTEQSREIRILPARAGLMALCAPLFNAISRKKEANFTEHIFGCCSCLNGFLAVPSGIPGLLTKTFRTRRLPGSFAILENTLYAPPAPSN